MSSDHVILGNAEIMDQSRDFPFEKKHYSFFNDLNMGSYSSNQILFDLRGLVNQSGWVDWANSFLLIPAKIEVSSTVFQNEAHSDTTAGTRPTVDNAFAVAWKNHQNLFSSCAVQISGYSATNNSDNNNQLQNFTMLTEFSQQALETEGGQIGFYKDSAESIYYMDDRSPVGLTGGLGECNNVIDGSVFAANHGYTGVNFVNKGRQRRMIDSSTDTTYDPAYPYVPAYPSYTKSILQSQQKARVDRSTPGKVVFEQEIIFPLKYLHDVFKKVGVMRGLQVSMTLYTNINASCTITTLAGPAYGPMIPTSSHGVIPFTLSPLGGGLKLTGVGTVTVTSSIGNSTNQPCRMYIQKIQMSPLTEQRFLSECREKLVVYKDFLSYQQLAITPGAQVNYIMATEARVVGLLVIPQISALVNGTSTGSLSASSNAGQTGAFAPSNGPFSSAPSTCMPYGYVTNFNVLVNGVQHYPSNELYTWERFLQEIPQRGLNGNYDHQLSSGLISYSDYQTGYGFIYVDLSRYSSKGEYDVKKAYSVIFNNASAVTCDYTILLIYEKSMRLSVATGDLLM